MCFENRDCRTCDGKPVYRPPLWVWIFAALVYVALIWLAWKFL